MLAGNYFENVFIWCFQLEQSGFHKNLVLDFGFSFNTVKAKIWFWLIFCGKTYLMWKFLQQKICLKTFLWWQTLLVGVGRGLWTATQANIEHDLSIVTFFWLIINYRKIIIQVYDCHQTCQICTRQTFQVFY